MGEREREDWTAAGKSERERYRMIHPFFPLFPYFRIYLILERKPLIRQNLVLTHLTCFESLHSEFNYFDSRGNHPSSILFEKIKSAGISSLLKVNSKKLQQKGTTDCGSYVLFYLLLRCRMNNFFSVIYNQFPEQTPFKITQTIKSFLSLQDTNQCRIDESLFLSLHKSMNSHQPISPHCPVEPSRPNFENLTSRVVAEDGKKKKKSSVCRSSQTSAKQLSKGPQSKRIEKTKRHPRAQKPKGGQGFRRPVPERPLQAVFDPLNKTKSKKSRHCRKKAPPTDCQSKEFLLKLATMHLGFLNKILQKKI